MFLPLLQSSIFISYILLLVWRYGILPSISDSWYILPYSERWLFTFFTWGIGIPMLFYGTAPLFISGAGLCFVGVATQFKMKRSYTRIVHFLGAAVGIIVPLLHFAISYGIILPLILQTIGTLIIILMDNINDKLWWVEILAFITVIYGLIKLAL